MAKILPEFDFSTYDPKDEWNFPQQRLVRFAADAYSLASSARKHWSRQYIYPDLRFVIWHTFSGQSHSLMVAAMHLRSHGQDPTWWEVQPEFSFQVDSRLMASNNANVRQLLQMGFVQNYMRQLDLAMRQIAQSLGLWKADEVARPLALVWKTVLKECGLKRYAALLSLWLIFRDSTAQLGRFCPLDYKDFRVRYAGREFAFFSDKEIDPQALGFIDHWDFLLFLIQECHQMLHEIFDSVNVRAIAIILPRYISG